VVGTRQARSNARVCGFPAPKFVTPKKLAGGIGRV
jgi:hypothetical protein